MPQIDKAYTLVNTLLKNASGNQNVSYDPSTSLSVATTSLGITKDAMFDAITDMVNRTYIKERPYTGNFAGLRADSQKYGYITRKVQYVDLDVQDSTVYDNTGSDDMYARRNAKPIQTNFYGKSVFADSITTYDYQLATAFQSASDMSAFVSGIYTNIGNVLAKAEEELARSCILNFMAGKGSYASAQGGVNTGVIHLITEFNTEQGYETPKTWAQIQQDATLFDLFIKWAFAKISIISDMMTERTEKYHFNITNYTLNKFTPKANQKAFFLSQWGHNISSRVMASTFHNELIGTVPNLTTVNFWQSPNDPDKINVIPSYLDCSDGSIHHDVSAFNFSNAPVVGCIVDTDALGYTVYDQSMENTPHNAKGKYYNTFWHYDFRYWNDFMENGVVFVLD